MTAEKKKAYGNMRIMVIQGKELFRTEAITALKNGKLNADRFGGIIDESLDTDKLCEVYKAHEAEMGYPYLADKKYCGAIVSVWRSLQLLTKIKARSSRIPIRIWWNGSARW